MAMTNRERQAKWRAKLRMLASRAPRLEELLREHMRTFLLDEAASYHLTDEDRQVYHEALESMLSKDDARLIEKLNAFVKDMHEKECIFLFRAKRNRTLVEVKDRAQR